MTSEIKFDQSETLSSQKVLSAVESVLSKTRAQVEPDIFAKLDKLYKGSLHKAALGMTVAGILIMAGCGNAKPFIQRKEPDSFDNNQPAASETVQDSKLKPGNAPELVLIPAPERGQLKKLPADVLTDEYLKGMGVTITNTGKLKLHLRKSAAEIPLITQLIAQRAQQKPGQDKIPTVVDFVTFTAQTINPDTIAKIDDPKLKGNFMVDYQRASARGKVPYESTFFKTTEILGKNSKGEVVRRDHIYIGISLGENLIPALDDLPEAPVLAFQPSENTPSDQYAVRTFASLGQKDAHILGHEPVHYQDPDKSELREWKADLISRDNLQAAWELYQANGDDRKYPFVVEGPDGFSRISDTHFITTDEKAA